MSPLQASNMQQPVLGLVVCHSLDGSYRSRGSRCQLHVVWLIAYLHGLHHSWLLYTHMPQQQVAVAPICCSRAPPCQNVHIHANAQ
jgi:hypothetical protein